MCTFENKQSVLVCDVAIHHVREAMSSAFGDAIQYTLIIGQGTRIEAMPSVDAEAFREVTRAAIAGALETNATQLASGVASPI